MNLTHLILFLAAALCFSNCKKEENSFEFSGEAKANRNSKTWKAGTIVAKSNWGPGLDFWFIKDKRRNTERLGFLRVPRQPGSYKVWDKNKTESDTMGITWYTIDDIDITKYNYELFDENVPAEITILSIKDNGEIEGKFNGKFKFITGGSGPDASADQTVEFKNGTFSGVIKQD